MTSQRTSVPAESQRDSAQRVSPGSVTVTRRRTCDRARSLGAWPGTDHRDASRDMRDQRGTGAPSPQPASLVSLIPSMARLAVALDHTTDYKGLGHLYRLWLIVQHDSAAHGGRGWIMLDDLLTLCKPWHPRTISRLLARGAGVFWTSEADRQGRPRIRVASQARAALLLRDLARHYGTFDPDELSGRRARIDRDTLYGDYKAFAAGCFKAWLSVQPNSRKRITLALLGQAWGRTSRAITEWIHAADIETRENWGEINANDLMSASPDVARLQLHPGFDREAGNHNGFYRRDDKGNMYFRFQRANTLHGDRSQRWKRGRVRAIARVLNSASDRGAQGSTASRTPRATSDPVGRDAGRQIKTRVIAKTNYERPAGLTAQEAAQARSIRRAGPAAQGDTRLARIKARAARRLKRVLRAYYEAVGWRPDLDHYLLSDVVYRGARLVQVWQCAQAKA